MSNMAKAKNIATGNVTVKEVSGTPRRAILKASGLGFTPNHVVCVRNGPSHSAPLGIWEGVGYAAGSKLNFSLSFDTDGFEVSENVTGPAGYLNGTYNYVAWQE